METQKGMRFKLQQAVELGTRLAYVLLATADDRGVPHVASAGRIRMDGDRVAVSEWFCPGTMANLERHRGIALVAWDRAADTGYQILGEVEAVRPLAMVDGYTPGIELDPALPQAEHELLVRVDRILDFSQDAHCDLPE